ncbi:hypothetical protein LRS06_06070 [Hymenobacter sp. J193]|uniref:hypothetical protein n=1 Tax=Hymenobacter sp. J193 TaxID=2898429 RepID=UPI0021514F68|nr:hypothetical protein [Hymenobacter sp. J193]MCR5887352.1 hypothetical protein [Hymenobacter sp. J193]
MKSFFFALASFGFPMLFQVVESFVKSQKRPILIVNIYVNNQEKRLRVKAKNIALRSRTRNYALQDSANTLILPAIPKDDTLELTIKINYQHIRMNYIPGWRLQPGATVSIGRLNNFNKVISIAKEDNMTPSDEGYSIWNNRYRIAPEGSVIDLPNITDIKQVNYIILNGYAQGTYLMVHRIIPKSNTQKTGN